MRLALVLELLQQFLLLLGQVDRRLDRPPRCTCRRAPSSAARSCPCREAELVAGLGAGRHRDLGAACRRWSAPRSRRRAPPSSSGSARGNGCWRRRAGRSVRRDREEDVEVARRRAAQAGLALAGEADAGAVLDPGRDVDLTASSPCATRPWPPQAWHGFSITWPRPLQVGQVRSMVKKPCCARTLPWPRQVGQVTGCEPVSAPVPLQASQRRGVGDADRRLLAGEGLLERDLEVVAQVGAARGPRLAAAPRRP